MSDITKLPARDEASLRALCSSLKRHSHLLAQITKRDIASRYRGSALGIIWSFITPLLMLAVYTFVFGMIFKARFGNIDTDAPHDTAAFAVTLFCGLIVHALLSESITRAPTIILQHTNYVKKVVFPLEILPLMIVGSSLFHFMMSGAVLLIGIIWAQGSIPITALYVPLILAPYVLVITGICWILASLGVYLRDIGQLMNLVSTLLLFLSPIFYPIEALPEMFQPLMMFNPLSSIIENMRGALLHGHAPDFTLLGVYAACGCALSYAAFIWFQKTRKGFADIL